MARRVPETPPAGNGPIAREALRNALSQDGNHPAMGRIRASSLVPRSVVVGINDLQDHLAGALERLPRH